MAITKRGNVYKPEVVKNRHKLIKGEKPRIIVTGRQISGVYSSAFPVVVTIKDGTGAFVVTGIRLYHDGMEITPWGSFATLWDMFSKGYTVTTGVGHYKVVAEYASGEVVAEFIIQDIIGTGGWFILDTSALDGGDVLG